MDPHWLRRWLRRLLAALGLGGVVLLLRQLLKPRIASHVSSHQKPTKRRFAAFLSHCKADAAMEARYLQGELERGLPGRSVFLDSDNLRDLTQLQQHVRDSDCLLLLQSSNVLTRPYCILELVTAIDAGVPVLGVTLTSRGYDFAEASRLLTHLDTALDAANPGAGDLLRGHGVSLEDAAFKLANTLPNIISLKLDTCASKAVLSATISDLITALGEVKLPPLPADKAVWLQQREAHALTASPTEHGSAGPVAAGAGAAGKTGKDAAGKSAAGRLPRCVPKLPESYTPRALAFESLVTKLTTSDVPSSAGRCVVARGMGGVGKTVIAAAVVREPRVASTYDRICWVSIGQRPIITELQKSLLLQLGAAVPTSNDEHELHEAMEAAASGVKLLLVIDDPWRAEHIEQLDCVDAEVGGAMFVTTRIRNLVPSQGANEVELSILSKEGAVDLLLASGGISLVSGQPVPPAALTAVELCGRLPLCIAIAGAMIREHEDDWEVWLVPALQESHGAELRTRSVGEVGVHTASGTVDAGSIEERVLRTSLRSIKREERDGVCALFLFTSVFAEDATIPAAVIDALAKDILIEAQAAAASETGADSPEQRRSTKAQEEPRGHGQLRRAASNISSVRRWLRIAIDHSLVLGSLSDGIRMHDLVRDYARSLVAARPDGGLAAMQRRLLDALLDAAPEGGFLDLSLASEADRGAELSLYFSVHTPFHLSEAFPADVALATPDGVVNKTVIRMLKDDEDHDVGMMRLHVAAGFEAAKLEDAACCCETAENWMDAGRLWTAIGAGIQSGLELKRVLLRATAAFKHVAKDEPIARELEAKCWQRCRWSAGTGFTQGTEEAVAVLERLQELALMGCFTAHLSGLMRNLPFTRFMEVTSMGTTINEGKAKFIQFRPEHKREAAIVCAELLEKHVEFLRSIDPAVLMRSSDARVLLKFFSGLPSFDSSPHGSMAAVAVHRAIAIFLAIPRSHGETEFALEAVFGVRGDRIREMVERYDFHRIHRCMHGSSNATPNALLLYDNDLFLTGVPGSVLALVWGELAAARQSWSKSAAGWARIEAAVDAGRIGWIMYVAAMRFGRCARAVTLAINDMTATDQLFRHTLEGMAGRGRSVDTYFALISRKNVMGPLLGTWEHEGYQYQSPEMILFVARGVAALIDDDYSRVAEWLPSTSVLLKACQYEIGWDIQLMGRQHPAVLGAVLYAKLKRWEDAEALATGALEHCHQPLARIEALRILAQLRSGSLEESAIASLKQAVTEARAATYVLMEAVCLGDLVRLCASCESSDQEGARAMEELRAVLSRMKCDSDEQHRLLGGDVMAAM